MARVKIEIHSAPVLVAPAGLWLEAVDLEGFDGLESAPPGAVYDPSFHDIAFTWEVEGGPLAPYTAPENMLPEWRDANRAYGKFAVLFFPEPGPYTILLRARGRSGDIAEARRDITVRDAGDIYPAAATICVSTDPGETWAGAPPGARRISHLPDLKKALKRTPDPLRLLFRRGLEYRGIALRINRAFLTHIGAWGEGPRPILGPAEGSDNTIFALWKRARMKQFTVSDIDFRGDWNAATETGGNTSSPLTWQQSRQACHYALWNCRFEGFDRLSLAPEDTLPGGVLVGNSVVTNWRNYGFLFRSSRARFALVGSQVAQHVEALHGDQKIGNLSNNHGPVRLSDCHKVYIGSSDFFSRSGWSDLGDELADQPCLRLNTSGKAGRNFNLDRIVCEGGSQIINLAGANSKVEENPGNYLIDKAVLIATAKTIGPFINVAFGGVTLRNILGILPDVPRRHSNRWGGAIRTHMDKPGPGNETTPFALYSSTFLNLLTDENRIHRGWALEEGTEAFVNATLENNILAAAEAEDGPDLTGTLPGIVPRYRGVRYNYALQRGRLAEGVAPGEGFVLPYEGITEATVDQDNAPATSQAYWQAFAARDIAHMMKVKKVKGTLYAARGDFAVRFDRHGVVLTNTGEAIWPGGADWALSLDRSSRLAAMDSRYASPGHLPLPRPVAGKKASAGQGRFAVDDLLLTLRGDAPSSGAVEPD